MPHCVFGDWTADEGTPTGRLNHQRVQHVVVVLMRCARGEPDVHDAFTANALVFPGSIEALALVVKVRTKRRATQARAWHRLRWTNTAVDGWTQGRLLVVAEGCGIASLKRWRDAGGLKLATSRDNRCNKSVFVVGRVDFVGLRHQ